MPITNENAIKKNEKHRARARNGRCWIGLERQSGQSDQFYSNEIVKWLAEQKMHDVNASKIQTLHTYYVYLMWFVFVFIRHLLHWTMSELTLTDRLAYSWMTCALNEKRHSDRCSTEAVEFRAEQPTMKHVQLCSQKKKFSHFLLLLLQKRE